MKLTVKQLRRVIREALVGGADRRMSGGRFEDELTAGTKKSVSSLEIEQLKQEIADQKSVIKKVKLGKLKGQDINAMQAHLDQLQKKLTDLKMKEKIK